MIGLAASKAVENTSKPITNDEELLARVVYICGHVDVGLVLAKAIHATDDEIAEMKDTRRRLNCIALEKKYHLPAYNK